MTVETINYSSPSGIPGVPSFQHTKYVCEGKEFYSLDSLREFLQQPCAAARLSAQIGYGWINPTVSNDDTLDF